MPVGCPPCIVVAHWPTAMCQPQENWDSGLTIVLAQSKTSFFVQSRSKHTTGPSYFLPSLIHWPPAPSDHPLISAPALELKIIDI